MNQFENSTHAELYGCAVAAAGTLRMSADVQQLVAEGRPTTHAQRRLIRPADAYGADRVLADLLDALARQVHHGQHLEGDAEQLLLDPAESLLTVFGPKLSEAQRNARHQIVLEAANVTLRSRAAAWLYDGQPGQARHARAVASNSGLAKVLAQLEEIRAKARHR